jgi:MFS family permease
LAVFTSGSINNLTVGKNGIFFDLDGKDWEATICHVVPNAISLTEAFFAPWRKVGSAIASTVHKFIAGKNDAATAAMTEHVTTATTPANNGMMMASVATLGIALSFVASAVAGLAAAVTNTPIWKTALVVVGIICIVSVPSVILTWVKLRARDLAPILNASDWAINRTIGFTARLGTFFTQRASYLGKRKVCPPMRSCHLVRNLILALLTLAALAAALWWYCCPTSPRNQTPEQVEPTTTEAVTNAVPETLSEVQ